MPDGQVPLVDVMILTLHSLYSVSVEWNCHNALSFVVCRILACCCFLCSCANILHGEYRWIAQYNTNYMIQVTKDIGNALSALRTTAYRPLSFMNNL